jgi:hypothetical protein
MKNLFNTTKKRMLGTVATIFLGSVVFAATSDRPDVVLDIDLTSGKTATGETFTVPIDTALVKVVVERNGADSLSSRSITKETVNQKEVDKEIIKTCLTFLKVEKEQDNCFSTTGGVIVHEDTGEVQTESYVVYKPPTTGGETKITVSARDSFKTKVKVYFIPAENVARAAFAYVDDSTVQFNAVSSFSIDLPTGVANGQLLFCEANNSANSGTMAYITSWDGCNTGTILEQDDHGGSNISVAYKIASSEPSSYTWTYAASRTGAASISAFSGVDTATPFQEDADTSSTADPKTTTAILPDADNAMLIGLIWFDPSGVNTCTEVTGFPLASQVTNDSDAAVCIAYRIQTTATSEGVQINPNNDGTSSWGTYTAVFRAAAGGGGGGAVSGQDVIWFE